MKKKKPIDFNEYNLKPAGSYRVNPSDFNMLLGTIEQADAAAKELLKETSEAASPTKPAEPAPEQAAEKPDLDKLMA